MNERVFLWKHENEGAHTHEYGTACSFFEGVQRGGKAMITNPQESFVNKGKFPKIKVSNQLCNKPLKLRMEQLYKEKKQVKTCFNKLNF